MRLVVLFPGALGDLCLLAPTLAAAIARGARVELSVQRRLAAVAAMVLPTVTLGPPIDGAGMASLFGAALDPAVLRWIAGADQVHAWLARADGDGGLSTRLAGYAASVALHAVPRHDDAYHVSDDYRAALGIDGPLPRLAVAPPPAVIGLPRGVSAGLVCHPGAGARPKMWAADGFRRVADGWREIGGEVAVLLGPAEEDDVVFWERAGYAPISGLSIVEAAALIGSAPTWLGNDSGMSHLAGVLGRGGVVVFCATRPERWRPLGGRLVVVQPGRRSTAETARDVLARLVEPVP
jgi:Glycosyltransferase family 9 (heptosyltransferase)